MRNATEIAAELLTIESRSKGELMKQAAVTIMSQKDIISRMYEQGQKLRAEVERCHKAMPAGHPHTDHQRISQAADHLSSYCATRTCDACPLSPACRGMGMELPKMLNCVAEVVEKPALVAEFASKR